MADPIANFQAAPFNGPFSESALVFDALAAAPFEGLWVNTSFLKNLNLDIEGTFSATSIQLYGTNLDTVGAVNQYVLTVTNSSITTNDVITTKFKNPNIPGGSESVAYTVLGGDTNTTIATALAAAINADVILKGLGFAATSALGVVTVTFPSTPPNTSGTSSSPANSNTTQITSSVSGGATETVTTTCGSNGNTIGSAITAAGLTNISPIPRYVKARLNSMTGSIMNAALQGVG